MKYTTFFQSYRISCLVQLLRIRFLRQFTGGGALGKCELMGGKVGKRGENNLSRYRLRVGQE